MLTNVSYAMVMVSDMERSVRFYRDQLGLKLRFQSPDWTEFDTGTTTLALHGGAPKSPARSGSPEQAPAGTCSIGFSVADLDAAHASLVERGVPFVLPPSARPGEGIRLAIAQDPDGLAISFAQQLA